MKLTAVSLFLISLVLPSMAFSSSYLPYNQSEYETAISADRPVVLEFYASWCPTCRKQSALLEDLVKDPRYSKLLVFKVDYDQEKELKAELGVRRQSTLILFKEGKEILRSVGVTKKDEMVELLQKVS